ncbi:hypothetical protein EJB05_55097, partial [Eragrostis curvula]
MLIQIKNQGLSLWALSEFSKLRIFEDIKTARSGFLKIHMSYFHQKALPPNIAEDLDYFPKTSIDDKFPKTS